MRTETVYPMSQVPFSSSVNLLELQANNILKKQRQFDTNKFQLTFKLGGEKGRQVMAVSEACLGCFSILLSQWSLQPGLGYQDKFWVYFKCSQCRTSFCWFKYCIWSPFLQGLPIWEEVYMKGQKRCSRDPQSDAECTYGSPRWKYN